MNIDNLTLGELKQISALIGVAASPVAHPYEIGANYLIRTVTMALTGRVESVGVQEIVLVDAAWIADTGRYSGAVANAEFNEVEPYPDGQLVIVGRSSVIDATKISKLPRIQK